MENRNGKLDGEFFTLTSAQPFILDLNLFSCTPRLRLSSILWVDSYARIVATSDAVPFSLTSFMLCPYIHGLRMWTSFDNTRLQSHPIFSAHGSP